MESRIFQVLAARGSGSDMESRIFQVPAARGSGSDMEPLGLAFSKYRPRVVVDGTWSLAFSKCRPRVVVDRTWSRLVSHFQSAPARGSGSYTEPPTENWWSLLTLRKPIRFQKSLKLQGAPHGLRAILVYVENYRGPSRLPPLASLDPARPGLCYRGSILLWEDVNAKDRVVLRPAKMVTTYSQPRRGPLPAGGVLRDERLESFCNRLSTSPGAS